MRAFYVGAIPLLATLLAALLVFRPARLVAADARFGRIACAAVCAVALCVLSCGLVNWFSQTVLGAPILSSRPFVTHWVNALVVEPNDNAFPCVESAVIGALFMALWAISPRLAWPSFFYAVLFCLARVFCGANFVDDVLVGLLGGVSLTFLMLSWWRVRVQREKRFPWFRALDALFSTLKRQTVAAVFLLLASALAFWFYGLALSPSHYDRKIAAFLGGKTAAFVTTRRDDIEYSKRGENSKNANTDTPREGEGAPSSSESLIQAPSKDVPRPGVINLGGNLPIQAAMLRSALQRAHLTHALVDVDVASLRGDAHHDNINEEQFASIRFQVKSAGSEERKRVAQSARQIVQIAFAQNPKLRNVDIVAVILSAPERDKAKYAVFSEGVVPVFSASVERAKLVLGGNKAIFDAPTANAGLWLRARSLLYFNERVLPAMPLAAPTSLFGNAKPTPKTTPTLKPKPTVAPAKTLVPKTLVPKTVVPQGVSPKTTPKIVSPKTSFSKPKLEAAPQVFQRKSSTRSRIYQRPRRLYRRRFHERRRYRRYHRE